MRPESILARLDRLADIVRDIERFERAGDEHGRRWELANLKLCLRWLIQDLEKELEESNK